MIKNQELSESECLVALITLITTICKSKGWSRQRIKDIVDKASTEWDEKEKEKKWQAI